MDTKVNISKFKSSDGIVKISSIVFGILTVGLSIGSRPYGEVRIDADISAINFEYSNFVIGHDIFFYSFICLLLLSGISMALLLIGSTSRFMDVVVHGVLSLLSLGISIFLLYGGFSLYGFLYDFVFRCAEKNSYPSPRSLHDDYYKCAVNFAYPPNSIGACECGVRSYLKFETTIAAGISGIIYAVTNLGLIGMAMNWKQGSQPQGSRNLWGQ